MTLFSSHRREALVSRPTMSFVFSEIQDKISGIASEDGMSLSGDADALSTGVSSNTSGDDSESVSSSSSDSSSRAPSEEDGVCRGVADVATDAQPPPPSTALASAAAAMTRNTLHGA